MPTVEEWPQVPRERSDRAWCAARRGTKFCRRDQRSILLRHGIDARAAWRRAPREPSALLLRRETIKQACASRALQRVVAAAARRMRGVPVCVRRGGRGPFSIMVPDDRDALAALRPVAAGLIVAARERGAVG